MATVNPPELPGTEVTEHWNLKVDDGGAYWGTGIEGQYSLVDGARKFSLTDDEKERFIVLGGKLIPPDILDTGAEDDEFAEGGVIYGVIMPPARPDLRLIRGEKTE